MKNYWKYLIALAIVVLGSFLSEGIIINISVSPGGENTDFGFIEKGITLIIGVIIACTYLIIDAIKSSNKHE